MGRRRVVAWAFAAGLLLLPVAMAIWCSGSVLHQFRLINFTNRRIAVTSGHTGQTIHIAGGASARVPHSRGELTLKAGSDVWLYELDIADLLGTPYVRYRKCWWTPFTYASRTVTLLLCPDGRIYAILPDGEEEESLGAAQPPGFPLLPKGDLGIESAVTPPNDSA